jgi:hypothetical protein
MNRLLTIPPQCRLSNISPRVNHPMIAISPAMDNGGIGGMLRRID